MTVASVNLSPALVGLLEQLDYDIAVGETWNSQRRERFMQAFSTTLDLVYPLEDETLELEAGEQPALGVGDDEGDDGVDTPVVDHKRDVYVRWFEVMQSLVDGVLDQFECVKRTTSAPGLKSELARKYPGCIVKLKDNGDGFTTITVHQGGYRG